MNDLTKDELYLLFKCVRLSEIDYGERSDFDNIKWKLQYMIDNYCEHEWNLNEIISKVALNPESKQGYPVLCKKCGARYE